ncbi:TetR/AcrR family transcriptional regulator [Streptomyces sp. NBC_01352]|nr:TetR/AcrR family transcriptional regulator [Streptomyces sp. NBC_01373]
MGHATQSETRARILEACAAAFAGSGVQGASTREVARRAGVSQAALMRHFPRKEDLLLGVLELRDRRCTSFLESAEALDAAARPLQALRGMLAVLADNERQPGLVELHCVLSAEAAQTGHPAHAFYAERYRGLHQFYATVFRALAERHELSSSLPLGTLATMTVSLVNGVQQQWLFDREAVEVERTIRTFLMSVVPALAE